MCDNTVSLDGNGMGLTQLNRISQIHNGDCEFANEKFVDIYP
jgi:hypothetical protein